jgi:hypothetical protein
MGGMDVPLLAGVSVDVYCSTSSQQIFTSVSFFVKNGGIKI